LQQTPAQQLVKGLEPSFGSANGVASIGQADGKIGYLELECAH